VSGGLLIAGHVVDVPRVSIANPLDTPWARLDPGDYRLRRTPWVRQIIIHTTKGKWPQAVRLGMGRGGADKIVADFWRGDPEHSAAHIAIDRDGTAACLADLATVCAYHATVSNEWSVGIELYQEGDGSIYEAVYDTCLKIVPVICEALAIPFQVHLGTYDRRPLERMLNGGPDCVGIFGHRDNTDRRGRGDPGDMIYRRLVEAGAEPFGFSVRQDIFTWQRRQRALNRLGASLEADGICGPATIAAMRKFGFARGRDIPV
jgi:hypothetical protein